MPSTNKQSPADIANKLLTLVRPYYKRLRGPGEIPEFKKSMKGDEVESLLLSLHHIIADLKKGDRELHGNS